MTEERDKFIPPADGWKQNCGFLCLFMYNFIKYFLVFFVVANGEKKTPIIDQILTGFLIFILTFYGW